MGPAIRCIRTSSKMSHSWPLAHLDRVERGGKLHEDQGLTMTSGALAVGSADPDRVTAVCAGVSTGTREAFDVLVDRYHAPLLQYLTRQTVNPELAADLTQESFLAAFRCLDQLADHGAFAAWLYGIARNQLRMEWRRGQLRRLVSLDWLPTLLERDTSALRLAYVSQRCEERDDIQRALDGLSQPLREALLLHSLAGFTGEDVARILWISPAAARKRISRAVAEFRRKYDDGTEHHGRNASPISG